MTEAWTGPQVAWTMARGYPGAFGRKVNSPFVWIALTLLFIAPFVDPRRLLRMRHLDLAVLMAFGVSVAFFNDANIDVSVPLAYPLLLYLLGRMLWIGLRRGRAATRCACSCPASWLVVGLLFLVGFRIGLNVADSNVIDVGYAGVIGADRLADGDKLWGAFPKDNEHGDTYGPVTYAAYVPFEQVLPWSGRWDDLPAAHAAAITFDLLCLGLLFLIGRRMRGPTLGLALAYAWAANPFTLYALDCNVNDALVAALVLARHRGGVVAGRPRRVHRARRDGEVRAAGAGAALRHAQSRGVLRFVLGGALALVPCLLLSSATAACTSSTTARWASRPRAGRRSRSGACTGGTRRRPWSRPRGCCWPSPSPSCRAGATSSGSRRCRPPCSSRCSSASRTGSTSTSCGSSGRCSSRCWATPIPPSAARPPTYAEQLARLPAPAVAWR